MTNRFPHLGTLKPAMGRVAKIVSKHWKTLLGVAAAALILAWNTFLGELVKQLTSKWLANPPALVYSIVSVEKLFLDEISQYSSRELGDPHAFNHQLDDNILPEYEIFKVRLRNKGGSLDERFSIEAIVNDGAAKIIDVRHVVRAPKNKSISVTPRLPDLRWKKKETEAIVFSWTYPTDEPLLGSLLYRSPHREAGYGKYNFGLIKKNCIALDLENVRPGYYSIAGVGPTGLQGNLSAPVRFPEIIAFQPTFTDTVIIDPKAVKECSSENLPTYRSLDEAIKKAGSTNRAFIVRGARPSGSSKNLEGLAVLYEDDLLFLKGRVVITFPDGLDRHGEMDLYFLSKPMPDVKRSLRLLIRGRPTLSLEDENYGKNRPLSVDENKLSFTPKFLRSYSTDNAIIITWPNSAKTYDGIRVFRQEFGAEAKNSVGTEIYDGPPATGSILCEAIDTGAPQRRLELPVTDNRAPPMEPPLRESQKPKLNPNLGIVTNLRIESVAGERAEQFFEDDNVRPNVKYKYTVYFSDSKKTYSYPIEHFASHSDDLPGLRCTLPRK